MISIEALLRGRIEIMLCRALQLLALVLLGFVGYGALDEARAARKIVAGCYIEYPVATPQECAALYGKPVQSFTRSSAPEPVNTGCSVPHFKFVDSGVTPVTMHVRPGAACDFSMTMSSGDRGTFGILSSNILRKPSNGMVGHATVRRFAYKPAAGFSGTDYMEIAVKYDRAGTDQSTVLNVNIAVDNNF